jgi:uncharacterized SAM-binding protein YcdF (DUF218 family)
MPSWGRFTPRVLVACAIILVTIGGLSSALQSRAHEKLAKSLLTSILSVLENRFERALGARGDIAGIVVLGGGVDRIAEAVRLARQYPDAKILLTGAASEEEFALTQEPGLAGRLIVERRARNTFENAVFSRRMVSPVDNQRWLMVTSAVHMPRSMGAFRAAGFNVEPWPVKVGSYPAREVAAALRHEIVGLVYYRLRGRTEVLLPGVSS